jgi:hypothetical protein
MWQLDSQLKIEAGKCFNNRTKKYLFPAIKLTNKSLFSHLEKALTILAVGVGTYNNVESISDNNLYVLIDVWGNFKNNSYINKNRAIDNFYIQLNRIRSYEGYINDYSVNEHQHMIVCRLPYENMKYYFLKGEYSKLYPSESEIEYIFSRFLGYNKDRKKILNPVYFILKKDDKYRPKFEEIVAEEFSYNGSLEQDIELDFPPIKGEEIFNFNLEGN